MINIFSFSLPLDDDVWKIDLRDKSVSLTFSHISYSNQDLAMVVIDAAVTAAVIVDLPIRRQIIFCFTWLHFFDILEETRDRKFSSFGILCLFIPKIIS